MQPLSFYLPTQIFFEPNCIKQHPEVFQLGKKALLVTGRNSAKNNGSQADVCAALKAQQVAYAIFDQVPSNPDIRTVYQGAAIARQEQADFIIAIGGGSPMDAAKAIALLACQDIPASELFNGPYGAQSLPLIHIPTTAGTGSEVTPYSILSNEQAQTKSTIATPLNFPRFALLDPHYQVSLPRPVTIHTALDAFSHNIESCLSRKSTPLIRALSLDGIRAGSACFPALLRGRELTLEERSQLMYSALLGGISIAHTGTNIVHSLGYSLTYFRHIDHGRANALLLAAYLELLQPAAPQRLAELLAAASCASIPELESILEQLLGEKETFTKDECTRYAKIALKARNINTSLITPSEKDLLQIYEKSFH